ncbi:hypothetical protein, partial [Novacetimonas pomaceti]|uniref:hypothetical protein n=1 Tax=Novacetimonas pomaceti TaxID=2021998 RepID=UPI001C2D588C
MIPAMRERLDITGIGQDMRQAAPRHPVEDVPGDAFSKKLLIVFPPGTTAGRIRTAIFAWDPGIDAGWHDADRHDTLRNIPVTVTHPMPQ